jgi:hypothetical protein
MVLFPTLKKSLRKAAANALRAPLQKISVPVRYLSVKEYWTG